MSQDNSRELYLATITVRVPMEVRPLEVGGKPYSVDESAAWEAATALSYVTAQKVMEEVLDSGNEAIMAITGEVTRLQRLTVGGEVEPAWYRVAR